MRNGAARPEGLKSGSRAVFLFGIDRSEGGGKVSNYGCLEPSEGTQRKTASTISDRRRLITPQHKTYIWIDDVCEENLNDFHIGVNIKIIKIII